MKNVLIVGAGPVGLINALILAKAGIQVEVIEAEHGIINSPRAMTYAWPVLDGLKYHGLYEDMAEAGFVSHSRGFHILESGEKIILNYRSIEDLTDHPFDLTLGQDRLAQVVLNQLSRQPNVRIRWGVRCTDIAQHADRVAISAETADGKLEFESAWVIAADGGRSSIRKALGLGFDGVTWPRRFVATNVYFDFDRYGWPSGYLVDPVWGAVVSKITKEGLWRVTFSESESLDLDTVEERIHAYLAHILPGDKKYDLTLYSPYSMHQRSAPQYRVGRVLLAGDSAHVTNPTNGFGLVGGMFDSFVLAEALSAVIDGRSPETILDRYATERRNVYLTVTSPTSVDTMRTVFYCDDRTRLEHDLITLRARRDDPLAMRRSLLSIRALETPSLVTGMTLAEARAARTTA